MRFTSGSLYAADRWCISGDRWQREWQCKGSPFATHFGLFKIFIVVLSIEWYLILWVLFPVLGFRCLEDGRDMPVSLDVITEVPDAARQAAARLRAQARAQRQRRGAEQRRAQLLEAATALVAERGVDGLHMRELGERCGYTAGALYAYFESREVLLGLLRDQLLARWAEALRAVPVMRPGRTAVGDPAGMPGPVVLPEVLWRQGDLFWRLIAGSPPALALIMGPWPASVRTPSEPLDRLLEVLQPCRDVLLGCGLEDREVRQALAQTLYWALGHLVLSPATAQAHGAAFTDRLVRELGAVFPGELHGPQSSVAGQGQLF